MSVKDRFNQPMDFYTEKEWENGDDSDVDWTPPTKVEPPLAAPSVLHLDTLLKDLRKK